MRFAKIITEADLKNIWQKQCLEHLIWDSMGLPVALAEHGWTVMGLAASM